MDKTKGAPSGRLLLLFTTKNSEREDARQLVPPGVIMKKFIRM